MNGKYSEWSDFGSCSKSCGQGVESRSRKCNSPAPAHGGAGCVGPALEYRNCKEKECPGKFLGYHVIFFLSGPQFGEKDVH